jgi:two-component sensor histidine kinase
VKNTLAVVQSLAHQTFREGSTEPAQKDAFEGRLKALATAHNLLTRQHWEYASLVEVVRNSLSPFCRDEHCTAEGPDFRLSPQVAVNFSLAVHELATNAVKYGALSSPGGRVRVHWQRDGESFVFDWREMGGPEVRKPTKKGFGTRLIERTLAAEIRGRVELEFDQAGLICRVSTNHASVMDAK